MTVTETGTETVCVNRPLMLKSSEDETRQGSRRHKNNSKSLEEGYLVQKLITQDIRQTRQEKHMKNVKSTVRNMYSAKRHFMSQVFILI